MEAKMNKIVKAKEPWLGIFFSGIFPGLGQIYARRVKKGIIYILLMAILLSIGIHSIYIMISPNQMFSKRFIIERISLAIFLAVFSFYVLIDSFLCVRKYNISHNVRPSKIGMRIIAIIGIVILICARSNINMYIKKNIIQAYKIPTSTMSPSIEKRDRVFVDKRAYVNNKPKRGDIVVFAGKNIPGLGQDKEYMKRIVGLSNETLEIKNGKIIINGKEIESKFKYYNDGDYGKEGQKIIIKENEYYVLGDNSINSKDSRYFGLISINDIKGRVSKIWWPLNRMAKID